MKQLDEFQQDLENHNKKLVKSVTFKPANIEPINNRMIIDEPKMKERPKKIKIKEIKLGS